VSAFKARTSHAAGRSSEPTPLSRPLDDAELTERLAAGDRWAQEAVYRKYVELVWGASLRLIGNRVDAADVVQATFAEALRNAKRMRARGGTVRGWLMCLAVHQARWRVRRRRLLRKLGLERPVVTVTLVSLASGEASPELAAELRKLSGLLDALPVRRQIAWTLHFVEGCSLEEVAEYCGYSLAKAKRNIAAAHAVIRAHVTIEPAPSGAEVEDV
jgi:RNA polymerase sigma-70 factor (ECF subfamily)